jgi:hypothetical protein
MNAFLVPEEVRPDKHRIFHTYADQTNDLLSPVIMVVSDAAPYRDFPLFSGGV